MTSNIELLCKACRSGEVEEVRALIATDPSIVNQRCEVENMRYWRKVIMKTPLIVAIESGRTKIVEALINAGADVLSSAATEDRADDCTPMHYACRSESKEIVELILAAGKKLSNPLRISSSVMFAAYESGRTDIVELLVKTGYDIDAHETVYHTDLGYVCRIGDVNMAEKLLQLGAKIERIDSCGNTPLILACQNSHAQIVQLLLKRGARHDRFDALSQTALQIACGEGDLRIVRYLIEAGADPNLHGTTVRNEGYFARLPPLQVALKTFCDRNEITKFLIANGAKIPDTPPDLGLPVSIMRKRLLPSMLQRQQRLLFAIVPRLGCNSPASLLAGFPFIAKYIILYSLPDWLINESVILELP